jgi:hypothetical protein
VRVVRDLLRGVLALSIALLSGTAARSATELVAPGGLRAGPWIVAPYFVTDAGVDDNLFRVSVNEQQSTFLRNTLGVAARLPVRNSMLELRYQADRRQYTNFDPQRILEHTAGAQFRFRFGSGDELIVADNYTRGSSDVAAVDAGGELVYRDAPFNLNRLDVTWQRTEPSMRGYVIRVSRVDLNFESNQFVPFFDYRGFEGAFEYRHPISRRRWMRVYYDLRRFNHFYANDPEEFPEFALPPRNVGQPYRREEADTLQFGMGGLLGRNKPFDFRVGYGRFQLVGTGGDYTGLVGQANLLLPIGGRTTVDIRLLRQPLPSNFNTYYIINSLRVTLERPFLREFQVGLGFEHFRNQYGDRLQGEPDIRKDQRYGVQAYVDWILHPRFAIRATVGHQRRESNREFAMFDATGATIGFRLGWF